MNPEIVKLHEKVRFSRPYWKASKYYDHPDGQDLLGKLLYTNKIAGVVGSFFGLYSATNYRPLPTSLKGKLLRYFQCVCPAIGMATAFTCVTYFSTNIRKKDDEVNYVLGALAAAAVLYLPTRDKGLVTLAAINFSAIAYFKKYAKMRNTNFMEFPGRKFPSTYYDGRFDYSLEPDRRGNWTK